MPAALRTTAPPARLALRHASGLCTVDADLLDAARRQDERAHQDRPSEPLSAFVARGRRYEVSRG
jgi:hypothetical protein